MGGEGGFPKMGRPILLVFIRSKDKKATFYHLKSSYLFVCTLIKLSNTLVSQTICDIPHLKLC